MARADPEADTSYTRPLAGYAISRRFEELPPEAIERAKKVVLHTIGVSLAGRGMAPTANSAALATSRGGQTSKRISKQ